MAVWLAPMWKCTGSSNPAHVSQNGSQDWLARSGAPRSCGSEVMFTPRAPRPCTRVASATQASTSHAGISGNGNNRTGWKNPRYDNLILEANRLTDLPQRAELFRQAENLLIAEEVPIVPLYFYAGFVYFNDNRIKGIYPNILDEHPIQDIWKVSSKSQVLSLEFSKR